MNVESALNDIGQARRDAADPESLRGFINSLILDEIEDEAAAGGTVRRVVSTGTLYVTFTKPFECDEPGCKHGWRYWWENGSDYAELTREAAIERL